MWGVIRIEGTHQVWVLMDYSSSVFSTLQPLRKQLHMTMPLNAASSRCLDVHLEGAMGSDEAAMQKHGLLTILTRRVTPCARRSIFPRGKQKRELFLSLTTRSSLQPGAASPPRFALSVDSTYI